MPLRYTELEEGERTCMELYVKWIGREAVIMWLTSNQIVYEVISYELLSDEQEALEEAFPDSDFNPKEIYLN